MAQIQQAIATDLNGKVGYIKFSGANVKNKMKMLKKKVNDLVDRCNATGGDYDSDMDPSDEVAVALLELYGNKPAQRPTVLFNPTTAHKNDTISEPTTSNHRDTSGEDSIAVCSEETISAIAIGSVVSPTPPTPVTRGDLYGTPRMVAEVNKPVASAEFEKKKKKKSSRIEPVTMKKEKDADDRGNGKWMADFMAGSQAFKKEKLDHKKMYHDERLAMQKEMINQRKMEARAKMNIEREKLIFAAGDKRTKQIVRLDIKGVEDELEGIAFELEQQGVTSYNNIDENSAVGIKVARLKRKQRQLEQLESEYDECTF